MAFVDRLIRWCSIAHVVLNPREYLAAIAAATEALEAFCRTGQGGVCDDCDSPATSFASDFVSDPEEVLVYRHCDAHGRDGEEEYPDAWAVRRGESARDVLRRLRNLAGLSLDEVLEWRER